MYQVTCPSCFKEIPATHSYEGTYVCECGEKVRTGENTKKTASGSRGRIIALGVLILAGFIHAANWDSYAIEILPLKTKQFLGLADVAALKRIATICQERKKFFCQENALITASQIDAKDQDLLLEIGKLQIDRSAFDLAKITYAQFFKIGGKDRLARYYMALALWKTGNNKEAKKQFHYLVYSDRKHLDAQAARSYVSLLMETGEYAKAQKVIKHCRSMGNNTAMFLESEWKEIQKRLPTGRS